LSIFLPLFNLGCVVVLKISLDILESEIRSILKRKGVIWDYRPKQLENWENCFVFRLKAAKIQ